MALKIQYNKTFSQQLKKQLSIRERALPTLKSKETALRIEVKKTTDLLSALGKDLKKLKDEFLKAGILTREFPSIVKIKNYDLKIKNVAGVKVPELTRIEFDIQDVNFLNEPAWLVMGLNAFEEIIRKMLEIQVVEKQLDILNYSRKKTTQKVNLYEKVQIPEFKEGVLKIKRYLEDEENLLKAAQKIVKERKLATEAEV